MSHPGTDGPLVLVAHPVDVLRTLDRRLLTARERGRGEALADAADCDAHAAAHLLVRSCAATLTRRPIESLTLVQRCPDCGSAGHGRPSLAGLPDVHVSLAHTRGAVVAGAHRLPLGVDVERISGSPPDPRLLPLALGPAEIAEVRSARDPGLEFLRHWVRKESLVKLGAATLDDLSRIDLGRAAEREDGPGARVVVHEGLHVRDWVEARLDAVVAIAGHGPATSFRFGEPTERPRGVRGAPRARAPHERESGAVREQAAITPSERPFL